MKIFKKICHDKIFPEIKNLRLKSVKMPQINHYKYI